LAKHIGDCLVIGVIAGNRRDVGTEFDVLNASTRSEDFRAGVGKANCDSAPHATAGASHERDLFTQVVHVENPRLPFTCLVQLDELMTMSPGSAV
jgi:hypothetical protein